MTGLQLRVRRMRKLSLALGALVLALLASAGAASAATYTVTTTADTNDGSCGSTCSLRDAVVASDAAGGANTINLPAGNYKLTIASTGTNDPTTGDLDINNGNQLTITGAGAGNTVIDGNHIDRVFAVQSGTSLSISGVTIAHGFTNGTSTSPYDGGAIYDDGAVTIAGSVFDHNGAEQGGAIYTDSGASALTITNTTFTSNFAGSTGSDYGGAIDLEGGTLSVSGGTFDSNGSYDYGGAIEDDAGSVTIDKSTFSNNNAGYGGAIENDKGAFTLSNSTFSGNSASAGDGGALLLQQNTGDNSVSSTAFTNDSATDGEHGGGISVEGGSGVNTTVTDSKFTGNASYYGAGMYFDAGTLTLSRSDFERNNGQYGGGINVEDSSAAVTIDHSTFGYNSAAYEEGGGIYLDNSSATTLTNDTVSFNNAGYGGGIYFATSTPAQLTNDTIADNLAGGPGGSSCGGPCGGGLHGMTTGGIVNTIVARNTGSDCETAAGSVDQGNNIDSDGTCFPSSDGATGNQTGVDPKLGPLQDNGGPALTQALLSGAPAIDAGNDGKCPSDDERGVARPQGAHCDVGAVEAAGADLAISKSAPATATAGSPFNYTITVTNNGPGATRATVTDPLPSGTSLYGMNPSQGSCSNSGGTVTCALGAVAKGGSATITLLVTLNAGTVTNTATVAGSDPDPNMANNTASVTTTVRPAGGVAAATPPTATTGGASGITQHAATVTGSLTTGGQNTAYFFQFGTSTAYGLSSQLASATTSPQNVSAILSSLQAGKTYHYRLVAINSGGVVFGADKTFRTLGVLTPGLTVRVKSARAAKVPLHYTFTGTLRLPRGVTAAQGCSGVITVQVKNHKSTISARRVALKHNCTYTSSLTLSVAKRLQGANHTLRVRAHFGGNGSLKAVNSKFINVHFG